MTVMLSVVKHLVRSKSVMFLSNASILRHDEVLRCAQDDTVFFARNPICSIVPEKAKDRSEISERSFDFPEVTGLEAAPDVKIGSTGHGH